MYLNWESASHTLLLISCFKPHSAHRITKWPEYSELKDDLTITCLLKVTQKMFLWFDVSNLNKLVLTKSKYLLAYQSWIKYTGLQERFHFSFQRLQFSENHPVIKSGIQNTFKDSAPTKCSIEHCLISIKPLCYLSGGGLIIVGLVGHLLLCFLTFLKK